MDEKANFAEFWKKNLPTNSQARCTFASVSLFHLGLCKNRLEMERRCLNLSEGIESCLATGTEDQREKAASFEAFCIPLSFFDAFEFN